MNVLPEEYRNIISVFCNSKYACNKSMPHRPLCPFYQKQSDGHCLGFYGRSVTPELTIRIAEVIQTDLEIIDRRI